MKKIFANAFTAYAAGSFAIIFAATILSVLIDMEVISALGVKFSPAFNKYWLYKHLVWGGIWGLLLVIASKPQHWFLRGFVISLAPALAQMLYFFPAAGGQYWGLHLGVLTPAVILFFYAVWGIFAAFFYDWLK
jgi:hypothetical protein